MGKANSHLSTKDLELLLEGAEFLLTGPGGLAAEDELGLELPAGGDLPLLGDLGVDERVVVLKVGTETLGLESGPESELEHGIGVTGPASESVIEQ